ncbi:MAG: PEGA domain-containing protein [Myxococcales bacterium]|nr:PEGA domain-containing protein [Myxococcales bacterium]
MPATATRTTRLLLLLAGLLPGAAAGASETSGISVWIEPQDVFSRRAAGLLYWFTLEQFAAQPGVEARDAACLLVVDAPPDPLLAPRARLAEGLTAYENLELDRAERELFEAVRAFEAVPAELLEDASRDHRKALAYLGAVWLLSGQGDKAQDAFRRLLVIDPEYRLDARIFPPAMLEAFAHMVREVEDAPRGAIDVSAQPDPALVFVDGHFRGLAPVRIERLPAGDHLISVRAPGHIPFGRQVSVGAAEDTPVACRLKPYADLAAFQREFPSDRIGAGEPLPRALVERARRARLHRLVLGRTSRAGAEIGFLMVGYDVSTGLPLFERRGSFRPDARDISRSVDEAISELSPGPGPVVHSGPSAPAPEGALPRLSGEERFEEAEKPLYRRWWFWTALGAGAAVTTLLAILLAGGQDAARSQIVLEF